MNSPAWYLLLGILAILSLVLRYKLLLFFAALMALASLASRLWMRYCLVGVTYRRELGSTRLRFGEETDLTIEVTNAKLLPLAWLQVLDKFPPDVTLLTRQQPNGPVNLLVNLMTLNLYERVRRTYRIKGEKRGEFTFGGADVISGDIFGFYWRSRPEPTLDKIIVYPKVVPVTQLGLPPAWPLAEEKTTYRLVEDPLSMATVREYVPGDSIRHIHWKATGHLNKLQTKVFDPGASHQLLLFCDVQTATNPYEIVPEYLELVMTATASIALHALSLNKGVGLYTNGGIGQSSRTAFVPASRNPAQATWILETLARVDAFRQVSLGTLLYRQMPSLPYGATIVVISATPGKEELRALLTLRDKGFPAALFTVGEEPIRAPGGVPTHHIGGRDVWRRLEALELA